MRNSQLNAKVKRACAQDPTIVCKLENLSSAPGYSEKYFEFLGLDSHDLKILEHHGMAKKGQIQGPSGGVQNRWILVVE